MEDTVAQTVWESLRLALGEVDGLAFYKHPVLGGSGDDLPDLSVLAHGLQPIVVRCVRVDLGQVSRVSEESWRIDDDEVDSPLLEAQDLLYRLDNLFRNHRELRTAFAPVSVVAMPLISNADYENAHGKWRLGKGLPVALWSDLSWKRVLRPLDAPLTDQQWRLAQSVFQNAEAMRPRKRVPSKEAQTLGEAIQQLDNEIALLDSDQRKVAYQFPPGPQRIRGLAGTGKTVLLAMKAATLHARRPTDRLLFTFNTQSLYNHIQKLISRFHRAETGREPDWDYLHIRHGWGGRSRPGVYSDLCAREGAPPMDLNSARLHAPQQPFDAACKHALSLSLTAFYDFVLVDEAQDFPASFFEVLWHLSVAPHRVYFAYDEMQTLSAIELPNPEVLFGSDPVTGAPRFTLEGHYPAEFEKDLVLNRSYRSPLRVIMIAHGIGLGIHNPRGCVQMLPDEASWRSLGYEVETGACQTGSEIVLFRPPENSPNPIDRIYKGTEPRTMHSTFDDRESEFAWVAQRIEKDVREERVPENRILVISLDSKRAKSYMLMLQRLLHKRGIGSVIPGLVDDAAEFAEPDRVTLSTVYRAQGNAAPVVYIVAFDYLYYYATEIEARNRAFTCMSRSTGWVRITGSGDRMREAVGELKRLGRDIPRFKFRFPDLDAVARRLDARETTKRRKEVDRAKRAADALLGLKADALGDLDREKLRLLREQVERALKREDREVE
jgi:superfamily I DNA and RNA helicase